jgi:hypothetical protein
MRASSHEDSLQPVSVSRCYHLDPIHDPRWAQLVSQHPKASVFHTVAWLKALRRTYGYEPVAFTTSPPTSKLKNGIVFCRIDSWLTGRRLVSLPFSDHCEPLCDSVEDLNSLIRYVQTAIEHQEWKYLEVRPVSRNLSHSVGETDGFASEAYFLHTLDLEPDLKVVFAGFDKDSIQRRILRAERAGLTEKCGSCEELLKQFYQLFLTTRRRQRVPPTPYTWFRNLICDIEEALEIRVAYKDGRPIAAIITLQFRNVVYYKYGCSDQRFHKYGATPWLFWKAITAAKSRGATELDLGRTAQDNLGLLAFKNRWVPFPKRLVYWRYPYAPQHALPNAWKWKVAKAAFSLVPARIQMIIGRFLYPHVG